MEHFLILFNPHYPQKNALLNLLEELHFKKGLEFYKVKEQKNILPDFIKMAPDRRSIKVDCVLAFGGDGTFLRAVSHSLHHKAPLLGINLGRLGFLAESTIKELEKSIDDLKRNKFRVQERMLLKVTLRRKKKIIFSELALNDAVIHRGDIPRLIDVTISSNRRFVFETRCDGFVASTPTGSTAYSLSAGGPIISPLMEAIVITPLNPHVLTVRPIVFSSSDIIKFRILNTSDECILQLDGMNSHKIRENDEISVSAAQQKIKFIKLSNRTFYQILRRKFHLGKK